MIMIKVPVKAQPVYRIRSTHCGAIFTIYTKVNLESIKWLSNKDLKLFTELVLTTNVTRFWKISLNVTLKYIELHNLL